MPKDSQRNVGCSVALILLAITAVVSWNELRRMVRDHAELFPWTALDLRDPVGPFTGTKLASLADQPQRCLALLRSFAGRVAKFRQAEPADRRCLIAGGVRLDAAAGDSINYAPPGPIMACPVAAALSLWERDVVQPAAQRHFDSRVVLVEHAGTFSCRRLYGRSDGRFSEHATANAIDVTAFRLTNGRRLSVVGGWQGSRAEQAFLRDIRNGSCKLFATVLSPDYNSAHADHFHLDQADRGAMGWRMCR